MNKKHLAMSMKLAALHDRRWGGNAPVRYRNHHYGMNAWREHNLRPPP